MKNRDSKCRFKWRANAADQWLLDRSTSPPPLPVSNQEERSKWPLRSAKSERWLKLCLSTHHLPDRLRIVKNPNRKSSSPTWKKLTKKMWGNSDPGKIRDPCRSFVISAKNKSKEEWLPGKEPAKTLKRAYLKWATLPLECTDNLSILARANWTLNMASSNRALKIECWKKSCARWLSKENRLSKLTRSLSRARKIVPPEVPRLLISTCSSPGTMRRTKVPTLLKTSKKKRRRTTSPSSWEMVKNCSVKPKFKNWVWTQKLTWSRMGWRMSNAR